jgi:hypothetical protein
MVGITVGTTHTTIGIVRIVGIGIIVGTTLTIGVGVATRHTPTTTITTITTITTRTTITAHIVRRMEGLHTTTIDLHTRVRVAQVAQDITKSTALALLLIEIQVHRVQLIEVATQAYVHQHLRRLRQVELRPQYSA